MPARDDEAAVLVADLDHRDGRLVRIGVAGVLVHVRKQIARVFFLQFDAARVELPDGLVRPRRTLRNAVARVEGASHVEVHVHVDAALLEGGDHVVELVELRRGELALGLRVVVEDALAARIHEVLVPGVHEVQAHAVDAEAGEARGKAVGDIVLREVRGAGEVSAVEADGAGVRHELAALHAHETMLAGRRVEEVRHAGGVVRPAIRNHEREAVVALRLCADKRGRDGCDCHHFLHDVLSFLSLIHHSSQITLLG